MYHSVYWGHILGTTFLYFSLQHQAVEVVRWEEGKKWQKKLDTLKGRLTDKTREVDSLQKQVTSLRELQSRLVTVKCFSSRCKV